MTTWAGVAIGAGIFCAGAMLADAIKETVKNAVLLAWRGGGEGA